MISRYSAIAILPSALVLKSAPSIAARISRSFCTAFSISSIASADRTGNKVDAAERNVQKAIYRLAVVKVNSGRELSEYEQSIYDMFEAEKEAAVAE